MTVIKSGDSRTAGVGSSIFYYCGEEGAFTSATLEHTRTIGKLTITELGTRVVDRGDFPFPSCFRIQSRGTAPAAEVIEVKFIPEEAPTDSRGRKVSSGVLTRYELLSSQQNAGTTEGVQAQIDQMIGAVLRNIGLVGKREVPIPEIYSGCLTLWRGTLCLEVVEQDCGQKVLSPRLPLSFAKESEKQVVYCVFRALQALRFLHEKRELSDLGRGKHEVHRSVCPGNIGVSPEGEAYLLDCRAASQGSDISYYYSPERACAKRYNTLDDIFGLGLTASGLMGHTLFGGRETMAAAQQGWEILTKNPLPKESPEKREEVKSILVKGFNIPPHWSPALTDFVLSCCQMDSTARPTAAELLKHPLFEEMEDPDTVLAVRRGMASPEHAAFQTFASVDI